MNCIGTLGPACWDVETLVALFDAGMTGMRLNLSHRGLEESGEIVRRYHQAAKQAGKEPLLAVDIQGPELRVERLEEPVPLPQGEEVLLGEGGVPVPGVLFPALAPGMDVLLDDGAFLLRVQRCGQGSAHCAVLRGGLLQSKKSIAVPQAAIHSPTLTGEDRRNLALAGEYGVHQVMLPFVRGREDVAALREYLDSLGLTHVKIIAKIENQAGAAVCGELADCADELCIARGDLGNDMPLWELPGVQKRIARCCNQQGRPFSVATQMLHSMITAAVPTRAEVSDVFNAVLDGATSLILTGETAVGAHPVEAMRYLCNTAREALAYGRRNEA